MTEHDDEEMPETGPLRRCIVTRESYPKERMIRFVVDPEQRLVADLAETLPGRGMWVLADRGHLSTAIDKKLFARAARQPVTVPVDFLAQIDRGLYNRCRDLLALCRRAGQAVPGFEKVREQLKKGTIGLVVIADDAADDGRQKITALAKAVSGDRLAVVSPLDAATMGRVFGRDHLVHVAVLSGGLATGLWHESQRLNGLRKA